MKILFYSLATTLILMTASHVYAGIEVNRYVVPNVKDDYCGAHINFQFCRCAFHDEYCTDVGMDQDGAHGHVLSAFREWNRERIQKMGESCLKNGGYWNKGQWSCAICTEGDVLNGSSCVAQKKNTCNADDVAEFESDWKKFSDFDPVIPVNEASYEVQQYDRVLDEIAAMIVEAHALEYDMEIDREIRLELREYKRALVQNIRSNITKAVFRLAWVTYNTVQGAKGTAGSYGKLLNPDNVVEGVGAGLKVIQAHIPSHEKGLQFDTSKTTGKIKSTAWNATLETLESVADPKAIAVQALKDVRAAVVPGPNITEAEVAILREQHLKNKEVDRVLADSYALNAMRRVQLLELEAHIAEKYNELQTWKSKEYIRVKSLIMDNCEEEK